MTYWHGGPKIVGTVVRPPAETGVCRSDPEATGDGWVYITPRRHLAMTYAATCHGWLYEVEPIGEVEQDPGSVLPPGASLRCRAATIVRRFRPSRSEADAVRQLIGPA